MKDIIKREEIIKNDRIYNIDVLLDIHDEYKYIVSDKKLQFYKSIRKDENIQIYSDIFKKCIIEINSFTGCVYIDRKFIDIFNDITEYKVYLIVKNILNYINYTYKYNIQYIIGITIENDTPDYMSDVSFTLIELK